MKTSCKTLPLCFKNNNLRFFIDLSYEGQPFHGWQKQQNAITVQETVECNLAKIFRNTVDLVGAGRTDTGVHARQLIAHFDLDQEFDPDHLCYKLNRMLPPSIAVNEVYPVKSEAHARFDALMREYKYYVSSKKNPFTRHFSGYVPEKIDLNLMNESCNILKKHRNFQCFSKVKTDVKTYNCKIETAYWEVDGEQLVFTIRADRFLRNMVRAIVGTCLEIGAKKRPLKELPDILESRDRCRAGKSAAAKGLFLYKINYPKKITDI